MEILISMPAVDFNFDSGCSTPYMSAPSSPKPFGKFYYSAPTSPTRSSSLYRDFNNISFVQRNTNTTSYDDDDDSKFNWDVEIDENIHSKDNHFVNQEEFAFDFSGQLEKTTLTADELFDCGKIRSMNTSSVSSPKSPKKQKNSNPFVKRNEEERGRERGSVLSTSSSKHRSTRSLSPLRLSEFLIEDQEQSIEPLSNSSTNSKSSSFSFFTKWRFRDFLLFRSASEGRATRRDPLKKYTSMSRKHEEQRNSSFRSTDGSGSMRKGSGSGSGSSSGSSHRLYYTANRAVQDELKRKTYLPYRKGLLGCVGFNPTVDGLARGLNSFRRG
ncbi:hypothetical protein AQUCO_00700582v1 [Aquilegia coerulea]|uniref:Uncharacterized protein n=1 Tax=Aquilegia coerulea TaxID=218851 RepID=A0A2G5EKS9_AQUCA|nr:hypothetical protein AQUCO_00700582v1 [Aquilegia coerulea]